MLGGKVGWGAVRTDNEGQTLAGMGVVAVGGRCLEATAAGGSTRADSEVEEEGDAEKEGNKDGQQNAADE